MRYELLCNVRPKSTHTYFILVMISSFLLLCLSQVGPTSEIKVNDIVQTSLLVTGIMFWWIAYFIERNKKFNYVALGLGLFIFVLK